MLAEKTGTDSVLLKGHTESEVTKDLTVTAMIMVTRSQLPHGGRIPLHKILCVTRTLTCTKYSQCLLWV